MLTFSSLLQKLTSNNADYRLCAPSPPAAAGTLLPMPRQPEPWTWICHGCRSVYRLGCTRRCLRCSHYFCSSTNNDGSGQSAGPSAGKPAVQHSRRSRRPCTCRSEFDYDGWTAYGEWRRAVPITVAESGASSVPDPAAVVIGRGHKLAALTGDAKKDLIVARCHSCWLHCDYPSECLHELVRARKAAVTEPAPGASSKAIEPHQEWVAPMRQTRSRRKVECAMGLDASSSVGDKEPSPYLADFITQKLGGVEPRADKKRPKTRRERRTELSGSADAGMDEELIVQAASL